MGTLRQEAEAFQPPQTLNIADLESFPLDIQIYESEEKENDRGEKFKFKYAELNGKKYRVPASVVEEIQTILKLKPTVKTCKVKRSGSGLATRYKVEAVD
jgi:hypothetical protein